MDKNDKGKLKFEMVNHTQSLNRFDSLQLGLFGL